MLRLIKLAMAGLAVYTVYEFYQGLTRGSSSRSVNADDLDRATADDGGRMSVLTGAGGGRVELTEDASGAIIPNHVGRGVR